MSTVDGRQTPGPAAENNTASENNTAEPLAAVDTIIENFGHHRRDAYFAGFAADATFLFHTMPNRLDSRAAYEQVWDSWESDNGFQVHSATSTNRRIQVFGDGAGHTAIFSHDVLTELTLDGMRETVAECETIVLERRDGVWLCVHEHLSRRI